MGHSQPMNIRPALRFAVVFVASSLVACTPRHQPAPAPESALTKQELPDLGVFPYFPVLPLRGADTSLPWKADSGQVVLVNFWTTWSRVCTYELPALGALQDAYRTRGFKVVGVVLDQASEKELEVRLAELAPDFATVQPAGELGNQPVEGLRVLPSKWLIDRSGLVRAKFQGAVAEAELQAAIESLL